MINHLTGAPPAFCFSLYRQYILYRHKTIYITQLSQTQYRKKDENSNLALTHVLTTPSRSRPIHDQGKFTVWEDL